MRVRVWNCCSARYLQLVPGQRAELRVQGADISATLTLLPYDRHKMHTPAEEKPRPIAAVKLSNAQHLTLPATLRTIAPLRFDGTRHEVMLIEHMGKLMVN